jgi:hypothetical protein
MLDAAQSAQGLNSSAHSTQLKNLPQKTWILRGWGELKRLLKGYSNGQKPATHERGGGVPFYRNLEN